MFHLALKVRKYQKELKIENRGLCESEKYPLALTDTLNKSDNEIRLSNV